MGRALGFWACCCEKVGRGGTPCCGGGAVSRASAGWGRWWTTAVTSDIRWGDLFRNVMFIPANPINPSYVVAKGRHFSSVSSRSYLKPSEGHRYAAISLLTTSNLNVDRVKVRMMIRDDPEQSFTSVTYALSRPADPGDVAPFSGFNEYFNEIV